MGKAASLRKLISEPGIVVLPGAYDCLSAMLIEQAGFPVVFTTGFGISASTLGLPDIGLLTATETLDRVRRIAACVSVPLVADMDTGYGNPLNVVRTVEECVSIGVAGIILEDQAWPKKCGHMNDKTVVSVDEHVQKIKAAVHARGSEDLVIIGRTDARGPNGLDDAIMRGRAYHEAGADVVFIEAPQSRDELVEIAESFDRSVPLFANMIEGGKTPFLSADELQELGYKLVVYPLSGLFAAANAVRQAAVHLKAHGTTAGFDSVLAFEEFDHIIGSERFRQLESQFVTK